MTQEKLKKLNIAGYVSAPYNPNIVVGILLQSEDNMECSYMATVTETQSLIDQGIVTLPVLT